jgi:hypothetical protein
MAAYGTPATCNLLTRGNATAAEFEALGNDYFYMDKSTIQFPGTFCLLLPKDDGGYSVPCKTKTGETMETMDITMETETATIVFPDGEEHLMLFHCAGTSDDPIADIFK